MKQVQIFSHETMIAHDPGPEHPDRPERLTAVRSALRDDFPQIPWEMPEPAPRSAISRVHDEAYISRIEELRGKDAILNADTIASPDTVDAACLAAGASIEAVDAVLDETSRTAWALVRPPGHHAESDAAMGFCFFNNIAIAAAHARDRGVRRVLIVDWDVHHGNGTQHIFEERRDILFFSSHQFPLYPGTGALGERGLGDGAGYTVNVPLPAGTGDAIYSAVFEEVLRPVADQYEPDLVLVSAGYDAHRRDPVGGMDLTTSGFARLRRLVQGIADDHCDGRVVFCLEGGYDVDALAESVSACISVPVEDSEPLELSEDERRDREELLMQIKEVQRDYWELS